ncbi:unnamed protein product [Peniophora sp. CBMAI 1063]|nr:unnamed protein product [Peniophora sp. CBMAI 1063]
MANPTTSTYRAIVREVSKASIFPRAGRNKEIAASFRAVAAKRTTQECADWHLTNALTFMRAQRTHKELLDRYNPLVDLTAEERIEATARRVGLNMPITPEGEGKKGEE